MTTITIEAARVDARTSGAAREMTSSVRETKRCALETIRAAFEMRRRALQT
jgi:hypothetical protein